LKEREAIHKEIIKQHEKEIEELKKIQNDLKQQIEESDIVITQVQKELQEKLIKMSVNYLKTGKIEDPKFTSIEDADIATLELNKYKRMVKCPTCPDNDR